MKLSQFLCIATAFTLTALMAHAQPARGGGQKGARMEGGMRKLLGEHKAFTADLDITTPNPTGEKMFMTVKMSFLDGKSRTDTDLTKAKNMGMPPQTLAQLQAFGMHEVISISRPDRKVLFMVYPGLNAYMEQPMTEEAARSEDSYKLELEDLGNETIDGHPCEKKKFIVTDDKGTKRDGLVWKATDLKGFPVQMQLKEEGKDVTMTFKNVKLEKPSETFEPPATYTKYANQQEMMQAVMAKIGAGASQKK